ncbi:hypothetical protein D3OALGA1CA_1066 [Olavius algarvensis associated proteobacterium Delta 3]|nr:hypothetical protein D3OALGA1CA_1066 [Olavius algarvensis associated proteobacterium Delta 3]
MTPPKDSRLWAEKTTAAASQDNRLSGLQNRSDMKGGPPISTASPRGVSMDNRRIPTFSFVLPTRGRPDRLCRLLDSFKEMTRCIEQIEVVLVVDEDDSKMRGFHYDGVPIKTVTVTPGLHMGALNMAAYEASTGRYIMILNDDVVIRTPGWDEKILSVFQSYADDIVLVHVNDLIFKEKLCTFPFVSRTYCDITGELCPKGYYRHRIDDHIYNIFNLLGVMGKKRIVYLPDVVFEHEHYVVSVTGKRIYRLDNQIVEDDAVLFDELLAQRKQTAAKLMEYIDRFARKGRTDRLRQKMDAVEDSFSIRTTEHIHIQPETLTLSSANTRVTVAVVSADSRSEVARTCLNRIKQHTDNYELILLDNNFGPGFNHSREMNRVLEIVQTDFLVLMDDDVFVGAGWLDGLFRCMAPDVGVVTPLHKDGAGRFSYGGIVFRPDQSGHHGHIFSRPEEVRSTMTLCSACLLIDVNKCGHIRFNEVYHKYFLDIDYGLRIWEAGYRVVCAPETVVTHLAGGTLSQESLSSSLLFEKQRKYFESEWHDTGRFESLEEQVFSRVSEFEDLFQFTEDVNTLLHRKSSESLSDFRRRATEIYPKLAPYPALEKYLFDHAEKELAGEFPSAEHRKKGHLVFLFGLKGHPVLMKADFMGFHVIFCANRYYAIPATEPVFDVARIHKNGDRPRLSALSYEEILHAVTSSPTTGGDLNASRRWHSRGRSILLSAYYEMRTFFGIGLYVSKKAHRLIAKDMTRSGFSRRTYRFMKRLIKRNPFKRKVTVNHLSTPTGGVPQSAPSFSNPLTVDRLRRKYSHYRIMLNTENRYWVIRHKPTAVP